MFTFMHQVQEGQKFRVTVSKFGAFPPEIMHSDVSWRILVEQLYYEELKNVYVQVDKETPTNGGTGHPSGIRLGTHAIDGRAQTEFSTGRQPSNITIVWDGGGETFFFNHYPFEDAEKEENSHPFPSEKVSVSQVTFDSANPNVLQVYVKSMSNQTIVFDSAIIKDYTNAIVNAHLQVVPNELQANAQVTLAIPLDNNFTSGTYTITLVTTRGGYFVSPRFVIP